MTRRRRVKLVREGHYAAEVDVELIDAEGGWAHICLLRMPKNWMRCGRPCGGEISRGRANLLASLNSRLLPCNATTPRKMEKPLPLT